MSFEQRGFGDPTARIEVSHTPKPEARRKPRTFDDGEKIEEDLSQLKELTPQQREKMFARTNGELLIIASRVFGKDRERVLARANSSADLMGDVALATILATKGEEGAHSQGYKQVLENFEILLGLWAQLQEASGGQLQYKVERVLAGETTTMLAGHYQSLLDRASVSYIPQIKEGVWRNLTGVNPRARSNEYSPSIVSESEASLVYDLTERLRRVMLRESVFAVIDEGNDPKDIPYRAEVWDDFCKACICMQHESGKNSHVRLSKSLQQMIFKFGKLIEEGRLLSAKSK